MTGIRKCIKEGTKNCITDLLNCPYDCPERSCPSFEFVYHRPYTQPEGNNMIEIKGTDKQDKINRQVLDVLAILASNATNYSEQLSNEINYLAKLVIDKGEQK